MSGGRSEGWPAIIKIGRDGVRRRMGLARPECATELVLLLNEGAGELKRSFVLEWPELGPSPLASEAALAKRAYAKPEIVELSPRVPRVGLDEETCDLCAEPWRNHGTDERVLCEKALARIGATRKEVGA